MKIDSSSRLHMQAHTQIDKYIYDYMYVIIYISLTYAYDTYA